MEARLGAAVLGLLTTLCDSVFSKQQEQEYIWQRPLQFTVVRCLFVLARYLALLIHITNITLSSVAITKTRQSIEHFCMPLLIFEIASCYSMVIVLQLILILRAFALYDRNIQLGAFMLLMLVGRLSWSAAASIYTFKGPSIPFVFGDVCLPQMDMDYRPMRNPILAFVYGELVVQFVLLGLVWKRTLWDYRHFSLSQPTLFSVLNRDGLKVFVGISVAMTAVNVGAVKEGKSALFIFPLLISLISFLGTRTILNLQTLHENGTASPAGGPKDLELTTIGNFPTSDGSTFSIHDRQPNPRNVTYST